MVVDDGLQGAGRGQMCDAGKMEGEMVREIWYAWDDEMGCREDNGEGRDGGEGADREPEEERRQGVEEMEGDGDEERRWVLWDDERVFRQGDGCPGSLGSAGRKMGEILRIPSDRDEMEMVEASA
ncbi:hypothetical protein MRB53_006102 [Persea americana]|uniref:Uncharacterized protein n=1 Tax=Persea americana TaxID=3435 RepID=A0ACC2MG76_PERAE|nr:hypothetical protein MRB53_006102 [Persea americana]